jgi:hypothetical protein
MERLGSELFIFTIKKTYRLFKYSSLMVLQKSFRLIAKIGKKAFKYSKQIAQTTTNTGIYFKGIYRKACLKEEIENCKEIKKSRLNLNFYNKNILIFPLFRMSFIKKNNKNIKRMV